MPHLVIDIVFISIKTFICLLPSSSARATLSSYQERIKATPSSCPFYDHHFEHILLPVFVMSSTLESTPLLSGKVDVYDRFTSSRKRTIVAVVSLTGLIPLFVSGSFIPSIPQIAKDLHSSGPVVNLQSASRFSQYRCPACSGLRTPDSMAVDRSTCSLFRFFVLALSG